MPPGATTSGQSLFPSVSTGAYVTTVSHGSDELSAVSVSAVVVEMVAVSLKVTWPAVGCVPGMLTW